jgi:hypothetical protein
MLPFMKPKTQASPITASTSDKGVKDMPEQDLGVMAAAEDLIRAVHAKDINATAAALHAAFEIMDSMPHVEGPHED